MVSDRNVLVVGTGTIGEPLIGLLSKLRDDLRINKVIFHKRTPLKYEVAKVKSMVAQGALLAVDGDKKEAFRELGHNPNYTFEEALELANVIIDCTPEGNKNKEEIYSKLKSVEFKIFIAQGSEKGFGVPYALGINDSILQKQRPQYIQVVSCNTHAMSRIIKSLNPDSNKNLISGDFVCIRRANDASQNEGFTPSPTCGSHDDIEFGTHHAKDVSDLFSTVTGESLPIVSSAMKVNSQYMHIIRFSLELDEELTKEEAIGRFKNDRFVSLTQHTTANKVFSFGRDHGFYGRIYNQAVVCEPSVTVMKTQPGKTRVMGFMFTPQDGNSLLTSLFACLYGLDGEYYTNRLNLSALFLKGII